MAGMSKAWRRILRYLALPEEERTYTRMLEIDAYARMCFDHIGNMEGREKWDELNQMTWHALRRCVYSCYVMGIWAVWLRSEVQPARRVKVAR